MRNRSRDDPPDQSGGPGFVLRPDPPRAIAGGYAPVPVWRIAAAWWLYRSAGLIGLAGFRVFLGCILEVAGRARDRGQHADQFPDHFRIRELARRVRLEEATVRRALSKLARLGLVHWSESAIAFPDSIDDLTAGDLDGLRAMLEKVEHHGRLLPIPRRLLRPLARCQEPTLIGTALGQLIRCLWDKDDGFHCKGRVKTAWIADVFGISERRVQIARARLSDDWGWMERLRSRSALQRNLHGDLFAIDPDWNPRTVPDDGGLADPASPESQVVRRESAPPPAESRRESAPLSSDQDPPSGGGKDQEPAGRGPAGVCIHGPGEGEAPIPAPTLRDVRAEDLRDTGRLLALHRAAAEAGHIGASEHDRFRFVAAAEHALAEGRNPCAMLASAIRRRRWSFLNQGDEDRARRRLREHDRGPVPDPPPAAQRRAPVALSSDAKVAEAFRDACARTRHDPFVALKTRYPEWTRERYDRAVAELEEARAGQQLRNAASIMEDLS